MSENISNEESMAIKALAKMVSTILSMGQGPDHVSIDRWGDDELEVSARRTMVVKNEAECLVTGIVLEPEVVDSHGDIYAEDEIFKAMESFNIHCRRNKLQHEVDTEAYPVESWQTKADQVIGGQEVKKGTWLMTSRLPPEEFAMVQKGVFTGFSVGCKASSLSITKSDKPKRRLVDFDFSVEGAEVSLVDKAANKRTILLTKAETQEAVNVEKNLMELLSLINGIPANATPENTQGTQLQSILDSLQSATSTLNSVLGLDNNDGLQFSEELAVPANTNYEQTQYMVEKSDMSLEDIKKSLESTEGQEFINSLVAKAAESKTVELRKENESMKAALEIISKREDDRAEEVLKSTISSYSGLGIDVEKDLDLFKAISATGQENFNRFKEILDVNKSALDNSDVLETVGQESFEEEGVLDQESGLPKEVVNKISEIQKSDASLTFEQALVKALGR